MNTLDDLLSSAGRVDGITPDILRNGRAALDEAITGASMQQDAAMPQPGTHASRKAASRWFGGLRGKTIAGVAVVAAAMPVTGGSWPRSWAPRPCRRDAPAPA